MQKAVILMVFILMQEKLFKLMPVCHNDKSYKFPKNNFAGSLELLTL